MSAARSRASSRPRAARRGAHSGATPPPHALNLTVIPWTVNEPADIAGVIVAGADGVITDYPDRARKVMAVKGLPLP